MPVQALEDGTRDTVEKRLDTIQVILEKILGELQSSRWIRRVCLPAVKVDPHFCDHDKRYCDQHKGGPGCNMGDAISKR